MNATENIGEGGGLVFLFVKNLIFTLVFPGTVGVYLPWLIARGRPIGALGAVVLSSALFVVGGTIYLWCLWHFARHGGGTPAPIDAPKRLVVRGPYRYARNPMYVGVLMVIAGWAALFELLALALYACAVGVMFQGFVVLYEEPRLRRDFGVEYQAYCARVGRWLPVSFFRLAAQGGPHDAGR